MDSSTLSVVNGGIDSTALNCFYIQSSKPLNNLVSSKILTFGDTGAQGSNRANVLLNEKRGRGWEREEAHSEQRQRFSVLRLTVASNEYLRRAVGSQYRLTINNIELKPASSELEESRKPNMTRE